jgi:hypothetical protein
MDIPGFIELFGCAIQSRWQDHPGADHGRFGEWITRALRERWPRFFPIELDMISLSI